MSYEKKTIKDMMKQISNNEIYLPAIQRRFVWSTEQIEKLFDSIMRNYPIGTFLLWFVRRPATNEYVFYKFIQDYHERDSYLNEKAPNPDLKDKIIGVLDGQQRLSSMYIALQGSYSIKKKYLSWENNNAFVRCNLHLNLLHELENEEDEEINYSFRFLSDEDAQKITENEYWFDVKEVLGWEKDPPIDDYYDAVFESLPEGIQEVFTGKRNKIKSLLRKLHSRIVQDELINFFRIEEQSLDDILKVFVRVNSGGTVLSKTDLLFSTIIASWEEGREEIEKFIKNINQIGDGFRFDNDLVMRSCLVLTDCPVIFKVKSFKTENVQEIKNNWSRIKDALEKTVILLFDFGFDGHTLPSQNAIIPIAYYIYYGGILDQSTKAEIQKYLVRALLKNIFSGQGDTVLANIRNQLRVKDDGPNTYKLKNTRFSFSDISRTKLPATKSFSITDEDIDEILEYKKGINSYIVLSMLYPNLRYNQTSFHMDHIHPSSKLTVYSLKQLGIPEDTIEDWLNKKDRLPNLQLMEGRENIQKRNRYFDDWLNGADSQGNPNVDDLDAFLSRNYIPKGIDYSLENFEEFYEKRKDQLQKAIKTIIGS